MDHIFSLLCLSGTFQMPDIGAFTLLGAGYFLIPVGDLELGSGMQSIGPSGSSCFVRWTVAVLTLGPATLHC